MCNSSLQEGKMDRSSLNRESMIEEKECGLQQQHMNKTSQVSEKTDGLNQLRQRTKIFCLVQLLW